TGRVHMSIAEAAAPYARLHFRPAEKLRPADPAVVAAERLRLDGRRIEILPGQAFNPVLYAPPAAAVAVGRHYGWTVLDTLHLARALNALVSIALGFAALCLARQARLAMFAILSLPMSVALYAAVSQDGPLIGLTALAVAVLSRAMGESRPLSRAETVFLAVCFGAIGMAKPPCALLVFLLMAAPTQSRPLKYAAGGLALAAALGWSGWMSLSGWAAPPPPGLAPDPADQAGFLLKNLDALPAIASDTLAIHGRPYADQFVGVLGWLDTLLPQPFYRAAWLMLGVALLAPAAVGLERGWRAMRWTAPLVAVVAAGAVFAALYLGWTSVGGRIVEGVQGRYLLPLALVLPLGLEGPRPILAGDRFRDGLRTLGTILVLAFPFASLVVVQVALIERYYG
ncbi:DUF2142 domain-containing protein, partial [uncultured Phenylobacterium sp.]|uniref:DUF2142 domain-containing protein n=1 Tax=uncultured Phenylobacterium sp. TaxID=349273 RepID=UPI0025ECEEEB